MFPNVSSTISILKSNDQEQKLVGLKERQEVPSLVMHLYMKGLFVTTNSKVSTTTLSSINANGWQLNVGPIYVAKQPRLQVSMNHNSLRNNETCNTLVSLYITSCRSDRESESVDEIMSPSDSTKCSKVEYMIMIIP